MALVLCSSTTDAGKKYGFNDDMHNKIDSEYNDS